MLTTEYYWKKLEDRWAEPVPLVFHSVLRKLYIEPSIGASNQISINLAKWFREDSFKLVNHKQELPMEAMDIFWQAKRFQSRFFFRNWPMVAMFVNGLGRNEQSSKRTSQRCFPPSFIRPSGFKGEDFFGNWPTRNKNCLCLLTDLDEVSILYRRPFIINSTLLFLSATGYIYFSTHHQGYF